MISRAAYGPRICLSCRYSLALRQRGVIGIARPSYAAHRRQYASDRSAIQDKDLVESLIRGDGLKGNKKPETKKLDRDLHQAKPEIVHKHGLPDWNFTPSKEPKKADISSDPLDKNENEVYNADGESAIPEDVHSSASSSDNPGESTDIFTLEGEKVEEKGIPEVKTTVFAHPLLRQHQLSIGALGHEVNALVLNNPDNLTAQRRKRIIMPPAATDLSVDLDWKSLLPAEIDEAEFPAEVTNNIEQVRPADTDIVRKKDFLRRMEYLVDGFTKGQLALYFSEKYEAGLKPVKASRTYPWLVSESAWAPSEPEDLGSKAPKQRLAHHILKDIWGVEIQEEIEGLGYAAIMLRPDIFELISETSTGALNSLKTDLLDQSKDEDIIPFEKERALQIYAPKASVSTILSRIDEMVQSLKSTTISVEDIPHQDLQKNVLDSLARVTKTSLQYHQQTNQLDVLWLSPENTMATDEASTQIESSVDIVLRLLRNRQSRDIHGDSQILLPQDGESTSTNQGMFAPHDRETRSLSWRDKLRNWSRYVLPIGKPSDEEQNSTLGLADQVTIPRSRGQAAPAKDAETQLSALFGHVLHSTSGPSQPKKGASRRRVILPVLPHPAAFTEIAEEESSLTKTTSIILNFIPTDPTATSPEIRLSLPVSTDDDFSNFAMSSESKLFAVAPLHQKDMLCPGESVDVRLSQQRILPLDIAQQKPIQEFFAASEFNLVKGRLRTPSHTQFTLPSSWLSNNSSTSSASDLPYTFAGLEIHQTIDLEWQDHILRYNSIEAGQHGGTRQELSLEAKLDSSAGTKKQQNSRFLQLIEEVVNGTHFSWTEGFKSIREIPEDFDFGIEEQEADVNEDGVSLVDLKSSGDESTPSESHAVIITESTGVLQASRELSKEIRTILRKLDPPSESRTAIVQTNEALWIGRELSREIRAILRKLNPPRQSRAVIRQSNEALWVGRGLSRDIRAILRKLDPPTESRIAIKRTNMALWAGRELSKEIRAILRKLDPPSASRTAIRQSKEVLWVGKGLAREARDLLQEHDPQGTRDIFALEDASRELRRSRYLAASVQKSIMRYSSSSSSVNNENKEENAILADGEDLWHAGQDLIQTIELAVSSDSSRS